MNYAQISTLSLVFLFSQLFATTSVAQVKILVNDNLATSTTLKSLRNVNPEYISDQKRLPLKDELDQIFKSCRVEKKIASLDQFERDVFFLYAKKAKLNALQTKYSNFSDVELRCIKGMASSNE